MLESVPACTVIEALLGNISALLSSLGLRAGTQTGRSSQLNSSPVVSVGQNRSEVSRSLHLFSATQSRKHQTASALFSCKHLGDECRTQAGRQSVHLQTHSWSCLRLRECRSFCLRCRLDLTIYCSARCRHKQKMLIGQTEESVILTRTELAKSSFGTDAATSLRALRGHRLRPYCSCRRLSAAMPQGWSGRLPCVCLPGSCSAQSLLKL